jgi:hypothetical protein
MYDFGFTAEYIEVLGLIKSDNIKSITEFDYPEKLTKDVKVINYAASLGKFEIVKYLHSKGAVLDHIGFMAACLHSRSEANLSRPVHGDSCVIKYYIQNMPEHRYSMPHILGINHRDQNEYFRYFGYDKIKVLMCKEFVEYFDKHYNINDSDSNNIHNYVSTVMFHYNKYICNVLMDKNQQTSMEQSAEAKIKELTDELDNVKISSQNTIINLTEEVEKAKIQESILLQETGSQHKRIIELCNTVKKLEKELDKKMQIIQKYHSRSEFRLEDKISL